MKNAAVICHARFLDLAAFAETLQVCGYAIRYYDAGYDAFTFDPVDTDVVVVLGGPIGAYEREDYPFIADEMAILRARVAADRPTLAICLGAQILAQALGARVYADTTEIGWAPVKLTEAGERSVFLDIGRDAIPVLHWHGAVVMGIGMAMLEHTSYDPRTGAPINSSLADYVVAVNADVPKIEVHFLEFPDPELNELGARGVGEIGLAGFAAAVTDAVHHATGVRVRELPVTIEKLLAVGV
jgi:anthranilate/para-aminobenzoate synthase component II